MGDVEIENVLYEYSCRENGWSQSIENGEVNDDGDLVGIDENTMWDDDNALIWGADTEEFWYTKFKRLVYVQSFESPQLGQLTLSVDPSSNVYLYYRYPGTNTFWDEDVSPAWLEDEDEIWDDTALWIPWTGKIIMQSDEIEIKAVFEPSSEMPIIHDLKFIVDVPDIDESLEDVVIPVGGAILPILKKYKEIKSITATIQQREGDDATGVILVSKDHEEPIIKLVDASGNDASGVVDVQIKGY
jgi:hypothetical protein